MSRKIGLWLIGARGGVSTTVAVGLSALQQNKVGTNGLVSCLPAFQSEDFVDWDQIVLGGHDIRSGNAVEDAQVLCSGHSPVYSADVISGNLDLLSEYDSAIRPGIMLNSGAAIEGLSDSQHVASVDSLRSAIAVIGSDLQQFKDSSGCDDIIVMNLASTEPDPETGEWPKEWSQFEKLLADNQEKVPPSTLYAIAALELGMPYVNFTPSLGSNLAALDQLAIDKSTCHMGSDGKTGETFLKSVLAPAFAKRNLEVMSWVGHNIFGNMDGQILDDPVNKQTKVGSKNKMLAEIMGYEPQSHISIEYIKSLGDWKTAWDHIHFKGFLGTPMTMTFTWQGCDSILAAPLVLDLFRFTELAKQRGETGLLTFLSSFFKSPMGTTEHDFGAQFRQMMDWVK